MTLRDFREVLNAAINGIKLRGNAEKGDKTMLDALIPALDEVNKGLDNNLDTVAILENAFRAAEAGVEYTKTIAARKGRASYLGDRSIGFQDPGATSSCLILKTIYETVKSFREE
jgi:dihydroxyacetone kinase-like protein